MTTWQDIGTCPRDGSWFLICNASEGFGSYEVGRYEPTYFHDYIAIAGQNDAYRKVSRKVYDWRGFNNMHRATHWAPLPSPPSKEGE